MTAPITLTPEMTQEQVSTLFEGALPGTPISSLPDYVGHDFQIAHLPDGSAAIHIEIKLTEKLPFTTVKYVVLVACENGFATEILSVTRGLIAL